MSKNELPNYLLDTKTYIEKLKKEKESNKINKLLKLNVYNNGTGTIINSSITFDQTYIDTYSGPYTVEGGTEEVPIIITFGYSLTINIDTYFIINCDYVTFWGPKLFPDFDFRIKTRIQINNVSLYGGFIRNLQNSNILIQDIDIEGNNSTLEDGAGWIVGSYFGVDCTNNKIESCSNSLPIGIESGGIVGSFSKIDVSYCFNYGELLINPIQDFFNYSNSGGICGYFCESNIDNCSNDGLINGKGSGGIISKINGKNLNIRNCTNRGDINVNSSGIVNDSVYAINIESCINEGNIKDGNAGILGYCYDYENPTSVTTISKCKNYGTLSDTNFAHGIVGFLNNGEISESINYGDINSLYISSGIGFLINGNIIKCKNYGNINGELSSGISINEGNNLIISECENYGNVSGNNSAGIILGRNFDFKDSYICNIVKCKNSGSISGPKSGGIFSSQLFNDPSSSIIDFTGTITDCSNDGEIVAEAAGGIVSQDSIINVYNCVNTGTISAIGAGGIYGAGCGQSATVENSTNNGAIIGANSGGIFGSWCSGTAQNCTNTGSIIGVSTGGIFGEFSTGTAIDCVNNATVVGVNARNI